MAQLDQLQTANNNSPSRITYDELRKLIAQSEGVGDDQVSLLVEGDITYSDLLSLIADNAGVTQSDIAFTDTDTQITYSDLLSLIANNAGVSQSNIAFTDTDTNTQLDFQGLLDVISNGTGLGESEIAFTDTGTTITYSDLATLVVNEYGLESNNFTIDIIGNLCVTKGQASERSISLSNAEAPFVTDIEIDNTLTQLSAIIADVSPHKEIFIRANPSREDSGVTLVPDDGLTGSIKIPEGTPEVVLKPNGADFIKVYFPCNETTPILTDFRNF